MTGRPSGSLSVAIFRSTGMNNWQPKVRTPRERMIADGPLMPLERPSWLSMFWGRAGHG